MANNGNNAALVLTNSIQTLYTCPAGKTAYINLLQACNVTATDDKVTVQILRSGSTHRIAYSVPVPAGNPFGVISGTLILLAGQSIQAMCTTPSAIELVMSALEVS